MTIPPPCALPSHILRLAGLLPLRFLPQDTINVLSDLLGFGQLLLSLVREINVRVLNVLFQNGKPPVNRFSLCAKYPSTFKNQTLNHTSKVVFCNRYLIRNHQSMIISFHNAGPVLLLILSFWTSRLYFLLISPFL